MFTAQRYIQKNPEMVARLKDGQMARLNKTLFRFLTKIRMRSGTWRRRKNEPLNFRNESPFIKSHSNSFRQQKLKKKLLRRLFQKRRPSLLLRSFIHRKNRRLVWARFWLKNLLRQSRFKRLKKQCLPLSKKRLKTGLNDCRFLPS